MFPINQPRIRVAAFRMRQHKPHPILKLANSIAKSMFHVKEELNMKNAQTSNEISAPGTIYFVQHKLIKQNFTLPTFPLNDSIRADCVWL